jgi:hypothetical protein
LPIRSARAGEDFESFSFDMRKRPDTIAYLSE